MEYLDQYVSKLKAPETLGAHVIVENGQVLSFNMIHVSKQRSSINILGEYDHFHDLPDFTSSPPLFLALDGRGILHKKVKRESDQDLATLALQNFPKITPDDLHLQYMPLVNDEGILSIIRKQDIQQIINVFATKRLPVAGISLGGAGHSLFNQLQQPESSLTIGNHSITIHENEITDIHFQPEAKKNKINLVNEEIDAQLVLPYCMTIQYYLPQQSVAQLNIPELRNIRLQFSHQNLFKKLSIILPSAMLFGLLLNFSLFSYFQYRNTQLEIDFSRSKAKIELLEKLTSDLELKQKLLPVVNNSNERYLPYIADQVGGSLTEGIQLKKMNINPLDQYTLDNKRKWHFVNNTLEIEGYAKGTGELNEWIKTLSRFPWIYTIDDPKFYKDFSENRGTFQVQIKLTSNVH